ncbi:amino acid adenylation domain-containing protein [Chlorogloea sp. CCALA 695]|uniref:amino acid adenylation domain-containing protein n=1 Tax=Chlorogloea sp. CCALA 695 TaxID=2107693 RepID=UPI0018ECB1F3|nr:amino acid adenylation domain-containing protein [Chlorogloea sp. CCALA 695]
MTKKNREIEIIVAAPINGTKQQPLDLSLLTKAQLHQLLVEWNDTQADYLNDICIHQWFEVQVKLTPTKVAVIFEDKQLTYQELNCRANQLAHYLQTLKVEAEVLVGICLERSLDMVVGLLGILKAGGAYVPLDPAYPQERLAFMLEDSQLPVLLTQQNQLNRLPAFEGQVVCLDTDWKTISSQSTDNPDSQVTAKNLAYIIYTSGSTGNPKGVQVEHGSVVNLLNSVRQEPGLSKQDVLLAVTTISFDIAASDIYLPLVVGACIVLVSREVATDPAQLSKTLTNSGATFMLATPATWQMLLVTEWQGNKQLKIICTGEALNRDLANRLLERVHSLWNMYGPTETTVWSTAYKVEPSNNQILIGRPIANTQIYFLDYLLRRQGDPIKLVPVGMPGELHIGGAGLARGYLNRPELNKEKFMLNPFSKEPGDRLYRTGDLGRYLPDGNIELMGRIDNQVKIRGFRIELEEIEAIINQHPAVGESVVIGRQDLSEDKRLVAYVVPLQQPEAQQHLQVEISNLESTWQWQKVWNETYSQLNTGQDPTFNIDGWKNSYTGQPTSVGEMHEWIEHTVERILSLHPNRVLEIGCGTGLLLFRIAPHCSGYLGTDIAPEAVRYLNQELQRSPHDWSQVFLEQKAAVESFEDLEPEAFDTVILNSVIQYFPSINYLVRVLESAVKVVKSGGHIFIGDVRNLELLEAFHTSVQLYLADGSMPITHLQQRIQERMGQDKELVIAPAFFTALKHHLPQISHVQIQLKRGRHQNELTCFRYDVILQIGTVTNNLSEESAAPSPSTWLDWQQELTLPAIRQRLIENQPEILGIAGIKNPRVLADLTASELLLNSDRFKTVADLQAAIEETTQQNRALDPEDLWNLSQELPYSVNINWSSSKGSASYDAVFQHHCSKQTKTNNSSIVSWPESEFTLKPWNTYTNQSLQAKDSSNLVSQLRILLKDKLPEYMVPSAFVLLDSLPLTPNGKVDRRSLPEPNYSRPILLEAFVAPRTSIENQLAAIWTQVLGIEPIGINDNFFELGGHSLLTVGMLFQVKEIFHVDLPLLSLFQAPTIAGLAQEIAQFLHLEDTTTRYISCIDLEAEAVLEPTICATTSTPEPIKEPQRVLLTGATGYIGAFLLHELLQQTEASIYCLVRASTPESGKQKVCRNLEHYLGFLEPKLSSRIIPVIGDLSQPLLGLTEQQFRNLAREIDGIYHNGAFVNLIYPYVALRAANVSGTQEVLRLASQIKTKPVHFISTLDVFLSSAYAQTKVIKEQDELAYCEDLTNGYAQSKWVAEKLVMTAGKRGIPVSIYRLGMVAGHSQTGVSKTDDLICRMIKSFIQLGYAPRLDLLINLTPVDYVSRAIVHLSRQKTSIGKAFHLINPQSLPLRQLIKEIKSFGYPMEQIAYDQWQTALLNNNSQENTLSPLSSLFTQKSSTEPLTYIERMWLGAQSFDRQNTVDGLIDTVINCPVVDSSLLQNYLSYFVDSGFLKTPQLLNN